MQNIENNIHPTAMIAESVKLGKGNVIGPYAHISGNVTIGDKNTIHQGAIITNNVKIGSNNQIFPYVCIGHLGEMGLKGDRFIEDGWVTIMNNCSIREYVNIHSPVRTKETFVGNHVYIMNKCYLAHDVRVEDYTSLAAGVKMAGRAEIGRYANVGMGASIHQRAIVGDGAMIGMNAAVVAHVPPYCKVAGVPARILGFNRMAAEKIHEDQSDFDAIEDNFRLILAGEAFYDHTVSSEILDFIEKYDGALTRFRS